jgi:hypothetical protein
MLPMMKETENGWATIPGYEDKLPLMFTLKARNPSMTGEIKE